MTVNFLRQSAQQAELATDDHGELAFARMDLSRLRSALIAREQELAAREADLEKTRAALRQMETKMNSRLWRLVQRLQRTVSARPWLQALIRWLFAARARLETPPLPPPPEASQILNSGLFDPDWYTARHPDAPKAALAAAAHYLQRDLAALARPVDTLGQADPGPAFDAAWYTAENPLLHYLRVGRHSLRATSAAAKASVEATRRQALGLDLPPPRPRLAIGLGPSASLAMAARAARSAIIAARQAGLEDYILLWPGRAAEAPQGATALDLPGDIRHASALHDKMLRHAAAHGATLYIAADAEGFFAPDCLEALLRMSAATDDVALVGAADFPNEHPRHVDPASFETAWAGGACLLLPVGPVLALGGLEPALDALASVDLSWRARQAGLRILACPNARYITNLAAPGTSEWVAPEHLMDGYRLARLWGSEPLAAAIGTEIRCHGGAPEEPGPDQLSRNPDIPDWSNGFCFAPSRW
jgi:hypothetical protein